MTEDELEDLALKEAVDYLDPPEWAKVVIQKRIARLTEKMLAEKEINNPKSNQFAPLVYKDYSRWERWKVIE